MQVEQINNLSLSAQVKQELPSPNTTSSSQINKHSNISFHPNNSAW
ncbi:9956_t:CDS:1, partial [Dentiscutata heterogama]